MKIPKLKIRDLVARVPIVQGGMGVGISLSSLAGNVALNGGIGVISAVGIGFKEKDFYKNKHEADIRALKDHIRRAKEIAKGGIIGVNLMTVLTNFDQLVKEAVKERIDIIFSGGGLPLNLPEFTKDSDTKIVPIVSSDRAAKIICRTWDKRYDTIPDAIVVEGPLAGGHLGYSIEELKDPSKKLEEIVVEVMDTIKPYEEKYKREIPIIAAGGIFDGKDMADLFKLGVGGVQLGSKFVATYECDASDDFKQAYVDCKKEDIGLIESPVGLPGRAIKNEYLDQVELGNKKPVKCAINCLKPCKPEEVPYCIANALISAQKGNMKSGFAFAGANAYKIEGIVSVKTLMEELMEETESNLK